jgi:FkbM family methyltransferase
LGGYALIKWSWPKKLKKNTNKTQKPSIFTNVPDFPSIELVAYYQEFVNYYPNCELETKNWFVHNVQKDWVLIDCGANIGYYSILFSRLAPKGHIYAFEPTSTYDMLLTNLAHHKINNVTPVKSALGKQSGEIKDAIFRIWGHKPENMVYSFITIDDFVRAKNLSRLDCIKIDVDSFDFEVLQGARETLLKFDPFVIVELNHALNKRNQSVPEALEWLAKLGYEYAYSLDFENFLLKRIWQESNKITQVPQITIRFGTGNIALKSTSS